MPTYRRRSIALFTAFIAAFIAAACEGRVAGPTNPGADARDPFPLVTPVEFVTISLEDAALTPGRLTHVDATTLDANHQTLADRTITWTASDTTVVSIVAATPTRAVVRALAGGTSVLTATSEGKSASIAVTVYARAVANVLTVLQSSAISVGEATRAWAFPVDSLGNPLNAAGVVWTSLNPGIATVSNTGIVSAVAAGSAVIRATVDSKAGDATLVVGTSSTPATPGTPGQGAAATVTVSIDSTSIAVGHAAHATVVAKDADGVVLTGKTPTWMSQNSAIATVDAGGLVQGVTAGSTQLGATIDGVVGFAPLTVTVPSVITSPTPPTGYANEPSNVSRLAQQTFDSPENADYYGAGEYTTVTDPSSPEGSTNVGQIRFPVGFAPGGAPGAVFQRVEPFASNPTQIYISFWVKLSSNWVASSGGENKVVYVAEDKNNAVEIELMGIGGLDPTNQAMRPVPQVQGVVQVTPGGYGGGSGTTTINLTPNMVPYTLSSAVSRGVWHRYELLLTMNTPGNADGGVKYWWDGTLWGDYSNRVQWTNTVGAHWESVYWNPVYNGPNIIATDQFMWLKNLYVSGR